MNARAKAWPCSLSRLNRRPVAAMSKSRNAARDRMGRGSPRPCSSNAGPWPPQGACGHGQTQHPCHRIALRNFPARRSAPLAKTAAATAAIPSTGDSQPKMHASNCSGFIRNCSCYRALGRIAASAHGDRRGNAAKRPAPCHSRKVSATPCPRGFGMASNARGIRSPLLWLAVLLSRWFISRRTALRGYSSVGRASRSQ